MAAGTPCGRFKTPRKERGTREISDAAGGGGKTVTRRDRTNSPDSKSHTVPADIERFRALAAKHQVVAYYAPVTLTPLPCIQGVRTL